MKRVVQKDEGYLMSVNEHGIFVSTCIAFIKIQITNLKRLDVISYNDARELEAHIDRIFYPVGDGVVPNSNGCKNLDHADNKGGCGNSKHCVK